MSHRPEKEKKKEKATVRSDSAGFNKYKDKYANI